MRKHIALVWYRVFGGWGWEKGGGWGASSGRVPGSCSSRPCSTTPPPFSVPPASAPQPLQCGDPAKVRLHRCSAATPLHRPRSPAPGTVPVQTEWWGSDGSGSMSISSRERCQPGGSPSQQCGAPWGEWQQRSATHCKHVCASCRPHLVPHCDHGARLDLRALPLAQLLSVNGDGTGGIDVLCSVGGRGRGRGMSRGRGGGGEEKAAGGAVAGGTLSPSQLTVTNSLEGLSSGTAVPSASKIRCTPLRWQEGGRNEECGCGAAEAIPQEKTVQR